MKTTGAFRRCSRGFTLIELMIAVIIVAILASVAIPSYRSYIVKANRSAAESFIMNVANKEEQYLLDARAYATTLTALNMTVPPEVASAYDISGAPGKAAIATTTSPPGYTIVATPIGAQLASDTLCGTVTIDQTGTKTRSGTGTVASCW